MSDVIDITQQLKPKPSNGSGKTPLKHPIPTGYRWSSKGVYVVSDDDRPEEQITTQPVKVLALTRDTEGGDWGMLVEWKDPDSTTKHKPIPKRLLHSQGSELAQMLADGGLPIIPGKERKLVQYLARFECPDRLTAAGCTGWQGESFVLPTETIRQPKGEQIVYQTESLSNQAGSIHRAGTLEDWQQGMKDASPLIRFEVCASLSAPIRYLLNVEAGGFHLYGDSSKGKSTALQAAASVWGNGCDPQISGGKASYISRWNSTSNALEGLAEQYNDLAMVVDEIGEGDAREFGQTIYRLISGQGRNRSGRSGNLRTSKNWRILLLSAGELAVANFITNSGKPVKAGQMVRLPDINLDAAPPLFNSAEAAIKMKTLCAHHYGHAGAELLTRMNHKALIEGWRELDRSTVGEAFTEQSGRVRERFAVALHTGYKAVAAGVLPWTTAEILSAVQTAYSAWYESVNLLSDTDRGVQSVADFILANPTRFETNQDRPPINRAGWLRDGCYHFTKEGFKEACSGADPTKVRKALHEADHLHLNKPKGLTSNLKYSGNAISVTSVRLSILGGNHSNRSNPPENTAGSVTSEGSNPVVTGGNPTQENAETSAQVTTGYHPENRAVTAERPVNTGRLPPLPRLPPENSKSESLAASTANATPPSSVFREQIQPDAMNQRSNHKETF